MQRRQLCTDGGSGGADGDVAGEAVAAKVVVVIMAGMGEAEEEAAKAASSLHQSDIIDNCYRVLQDALPVRCRRLGYLGRSASSCQRRAGHSSALQPWENP